MSSFVFEGIIIAQGETQSGQSQNGNKWMKVWYTIQQYLAKILKDGGTFKGWWITEAADTPGA